ncbi:uncharacterized protein LOC134206915 [Armigeres subalbatus]|uniref:uncharacterized protein LOC134206915 n=1 Tax=Armigeres subalbatus TaxID=124917 RepID=UPI002ED46BC6
MAARAVKKDVYTVGVLTGTNTEEEAMELRTQLDSLLSKGGFSLRKWASNCPKVLEGKENLAIANTEEVSLDPDPSVKTLGLVWLPGTDRIEFRFKIGFPNFDEDLSKRKVLSIIASLFGQLGLIEAVILRAKLFMQLL